MPKSGKPSQAHASNGSETPVTKTTKKTAKVTNTGEPAKTAKKAKNAAKLSNETRTPPAWLDNPDYMVFTSTPTYVPPFPLTSLEIRDNDTLGRVPLTSLEVRDSDVLGQRAVRRALTRQTAVRRRWLKHIVEPDDELSAPGGLFGRAREEVKADFERVMTQLQFVLDGMSQVTKNYDLDEITFELGFTAQGKVVFIAEASVAATITATFKRRQADSAG